MNILKNLKLSGRMRWNAGYIPDRPIGKGTDRTWRPTRRASSLRARANRRKKKEQRSC